MVFDSFLQSILQCGSKITITYAGSYNTFDMSLYSSLNKQTGRFGMTKDDLDSR